MTPVPLTIVAAVARLCVGKLRNQALEVAKDVEKPPSLLRVFRLGHFAGGTLGLEQVMNFIEAFHRAAQAILLSSGSPRRLRSSARNLFRHKGCALKALCVTHHHLEEVAGKFGLVHADGFHMQAQQ
jgi:hypothetical protein